MDDVLVVGVARTAIDKVGGVLAKAEAAQLGAHVIGAVLERAGVASARVSEVIMGQVLTAGCGQNPAHQAAIGAGLPYMVPEVTINKVCGSALNAAILGAQAIATGDANIAVGSGQGSMSLAPHDVPEFREGFRTGYAKLVDSRIVCGLWDVYNQYHMGVMAENVAKEYAVSRAEQDEFALASQHKVEAAQKAERFKDEIVPIEIASKRGTAVVADDEYPRYGATIEVLQNLNPAFDKNGTVTAGNASGINDGAAAVILASARKGARARTQVAGARKGNSLRSESIRGTWAWDDRCRHLSAASHGPAG